MDQYPVKVLTESERKLINRVNMQLAGLQQELTAMFPGRRHLIVSTILALAMGENIMLYGRPGTAKSLFMEAVASALEDANIFRIQINSQTPPSHLIGTQILKRLDDGVVDFNLDGSMVTCDCAIIDEYLNANPMTMVSMNMILHERAWVNGKKYVPARLRTAMVATNLDPSQYSTDPRVLANLDRFMFKCLVEDLVERTDKLSMLGASLAGRRGYSCRTKIKIADLVAYQDLIKNDNFIADALMLSAYLDIVDKVEKETGLNYTDRSTVKVLQLLEAQALMDGQQQVQLDDLVVLYPAFAHDSSPDFYAAFSKIVSETVKKYESQIGKQIDGAELALIDQLMSQIPSVTRQSDSDQLIAALRQIENIKQKMEPIKPALPGTQKKLTELEAKVIELEAKISKYMKGL